MKLKEGNKMIIKVNGRQSNEYLVLGFQTNPDKIFEDITRTINFWKPAKAKSCTVFDLRYTDYHGYEVNHITGYGEFKVKYFTTKKEGETLL